MAQKRNIWDGIQKEAEQEYKNAKIEFSDTYALGFHDGYIAGATEYTTKAQKLVETLEMAKREIVALYKQKGYAESFVTRTIDEALSSWNEGKEGKV